MAQVWRWMMGQLEEAGAGIRVGIWWNVVLLAGSLAALPFDHRVILGLNPWIKPIKFEISVIIFLVTMGLLLALVAQSGRWLRLRVWLGWGFGIAMMVENTLIAMQSARGVPSHMNYTTPFNALTFSVMGIFILGNTVLLAILLGLFFKVRLQRTRPEIWGIRLGLGFLLAGSLEGVGMVMHQAHTVGAADGGPGLPFVNWSLHHGDLRIAHFLAIHALQVLWLAGWGIGRLRVQQRLGIGLMVAAATAYGSLVWALFAQAMAGRPLLAGW